METRDPGSHRPETIDPDPYRGSGGVPPYIYRMRIVLCTRYHARWGQYMRGVAISVT